MHDNECEEIPIVTYTYTVVDPWAVVVKFVDALVALETVTRTRGPEQFALETKSGSVVNFQELKKFVF